jgi:glutamine amidotransferase
MQILFEDSEEGPGRGIGYFDGSVRRLRTRIVPQMGWNEVVSAEDPLFDGVESLVAYYANSYVCDPVDSSVVIARTDYEGDSFPAAVRRGSTWGVQFHPEKSSRLGVRVIRNFLSLAHRDPDGGDSE